MPSPGLAVGVRDWGPPPCGVPVWGVGLPGEVRVWSLRIAGWVVLLTVLDGGMVDEGGV